MDEVSRFQPGRRRQVRFRGPGPVALLWMLSGLTSVPVGLAGPLHGELRSVLSRLPHTEVRVSAAVIDLAGQEADFSYNADATLTPASVMKVLTMAAGLLELGPGFVFETRLASDGANLVVIGDGDPGFGDPRLHEERQEPIISDFQRWAGRLAAIGLTSFPGGLIIDESIFDGQHVHPSWEESDLDNWFAAPVGALNLNDNCVDITVLPGEAAGAPVTVLFEPPTGLVEIVNLCRTGAGEPILHHPHDTFEYRITGRCDRRWPFPPVSFPDPGLLFADSMRTVFARGGVSIAGGIRRQRVREPGGALPQSLVVIDRRLTVIDDVLRRIGKNSQNLFAECLLKRTGYAWAQRKGDSAAIGSWETGRKAVYDHLRRAGVDVAGLTVADGSGLSRDNACSARHLTDLLAWMSRSTDPAVFRPFHDNLSEAGVDGSLRRRLREEPGVVFAKTGTMRSVRTLAGYVDGPEGPRFAFAVMFNGYPGPSTPYKRVQDEFCRVLIDAASDGR